MVNSDNSQIINEIFRAVAREYGRDEFLPAGVETVALAPGRLASYAEPCAESGEKELAIKNYRRSLELNPKNDNAVRMLKKLEGAKQ
jgi:hypothetical protein